MEVPPQCALAPIYPPRPCPIRNSNTLPMGHRRQIARFALAVDLRRAPTLCLILCFLNQSKKGALKTCTFCWEARKRPHKSKPKPGPGTARATSRGFFRPRGHKAPGFQLGEDQSSDHQPNEGADGAQEDLKQLRWKYLFPFFMPQKPASQEILHEARQIPGKIWGFL